MVHPFSNRREGGGGGGGGGGDQTHFGVGVKQKERGRRGAKKTYTFT